MNQADAAVIRLACGAERRACLMLLPELVEPGWEPPSILVREDPYQLLGAFAWKPRNAGNDGSSLQILMRVVPPFQGLGLGQRMLAHLRQLAAQRQVAALDVLLDDSAPEQLLTWLERRGFRPLKIEPVVVAPIAPFHAHCSALLTRLRARGGLIHQASVAPLRTMKPEPLSRLYCAAVGGPAWAARLRLEHACAIAEEAPNLGIVLEGEPVALLLSQRHRQQSHTCVVTARAVAPHLQASRSGLGWPNLMLMSEAMTRALERGYERVQFSWFEGNAQTQSLARRLGAEEVGRLKVWRDERILTLPENNGSPLMFTG